MKILFEYFFFFLSNLPIIFDIGIVPPYSDGNIDRSNAFIDSTDVKNLIRLRNFSVTKPNAKSAANLIDACILMALISLCRIGNVFYV